MRFSDKALKSIGYVSLFLAGLCLIVMIKMCSAGGASKGKVVYGYTNHK